MTTPISPEAKEAIQQRVLSYPDNWVCHICAFDMIDRISGKSLCAYNIRGGACHGSLTRTEPYICVNAHKPTFDKDLTLWVARESPFAPGVLNAHSEDELLNHAMVIDSDVVGHGGALWLCKVIRCNTEDDWKIVTWKKLQEHGLDGLQAFIGASILGPQGFPLETQTHCGLYTYVNPELLRQWYDEIRTMKRNDTIDAQRNKWQSGGWPNWGSLAGKKVKKPDGWGGFTEVTEPCDVKDYASKLKEIFEGDPKNVG